MIRRHSVCLSDIPSLTEPQEHSYPDYDDDYSYGHDYPDGKDANGDNGYNPNDTITIFALRSVSSPVMTSSSSTTNPTRMATAAAAAEAVNTSAQSMTPGSSTAPAIPANNYLEPPKTAKKAKKKKKNKRSKVKDKNKEDSPGSAHSVTAANGETATAVDDGGGGGQSQTKKENISSPLIVNGTNWKHRMTEQMAAEPTHNHTHAHDGDDGLQRFLSTHHPPLYMRAPTTSQPSTAISGAALTPSEATREDTVRASSIPSERPHPHDTQHSSNIPAGHDRVSGRDHVPVCPEHGRVLCRVSPGCCVHRTVPGGCAYCPVSRSCCCVHHAGDCCYCVLPGGSGAGDADETYMQTSIQEEEEEEEEEVGPEASEPEQQTQLISTDDIDIGHTTTPTNETINETQNQAQAQAQAQSNLATYTLALLETESFSDCRLTLKSPVDNFYPITFRAHKALLARSPRMASILRTPSHHHGASSEIEAVTGDAFCMVQAFETAVQSLYGLPALDRAALRRATVMALGYDYRDEDWHDGNEGEGKVPFPIHAAMADFALCYAVSGAFFEDEGIVEVGVRLAMEVVHWENIDMLLSFALCPERFLITCPDDDDNDQPSETQDNDNDQTHALLKIHCPTLTKTALTHLAAYLPPTTPFQLYNSAQSTASLLPDRIPEPLRRVPGSVLSNPKLAEVKFGSFTSFQETRPSPAVERASAVLLSLPFETLKVAFCVLDDCALLTAGVAKAVVVEREARRFYALRVWGKWKGEREREIKEQEKKARRLKRRNGRGAATSAGGEHDGAGAGAGDIGDEEVKVLGYREFFTTKSVHPGEEQAMQISLEREWVGLVIP